GLERIAAREDRARLPAEFGVRGCVAMEDHGRLANRLAGAVAEQLLALAVAALHDAVAREDDADRCVFEHRLLVEQHPRHILLDGAPLADVAQRPARLRRLARGAERLAVDLAPERRAVAALRLELSVPGLACRRLGAVDRRHEKGGRLPDELGLR